VTLHHAPFSINVSVACTAADTVSLCPPTGGQKIIPLFPVTREVNFGRYIKLPAKRKGVVTVHAHPYNLLFGTTYHGVQCRTLDRIILCVDHPVTPALSYNAFYVGVSRVRRTADVRLLQLRSTDSDATVLRRLRSLVPRANIVHYMAKHRSMPVTFKHLRDQYRAVGIAYDKAGADKTMPTACTAAHRYHCRKNCTATFPTATCRNTHEAQCTVPGTASDLFPCRRNCGKSWTKDAHRRLHERHCKAGLPDQDRAAAIQLQAPLDRASAEPRPGPSGGCLSGMLLDVLDHVDATVGVDASNLALDIARSTLPVQTARELETKGKRRRHT
jgi:hypothetical protein